MTADPFSEGNDENSRWKWNETIGPVENRPGRNGTWDYYNTDGLGEFHMVSP